MTCVSSTNVICKHVNASLWYYVDLDWIPAGVTVVSAEASSDDDSLTIGEPVVLSQSVVIDEGNECGGSLTVVANRALAIQIADGTPDDGNEVLVSVTWTQSDGNTDGRYLRLIVR